MNQGTSYYSIVETVYAPSLLFYGQPFLFINKFVFVLPKAMNIRINRYFCID